MGQSAHEASAVPTGSGVGYPDGPRDVPRGRDSSKSHVLLLLGLIFVVGALTTISHWPSLSAQALSFDDHQYLTTNVLVSNPSWETAGRFLVEVLEPSTIDGYYQPLAMISLMLDYALGGRPDHLRPFHRTSLALHVFNTALLIALLYRLFGQVVPAALAGMLFGVHPLTVEPVTWVSDRKTLLAAFFTLWSLLAYVHHTRRGGWKWLITSLVMYLLALMSKPTAAPLPALLLLLDYWPLRRIRLRTILEKVPFFALGGALVLVALASQSRTAGVIAASQTPLSRTLLAICHLDTFYLGKFIWPVNLCSVYPRPDPLSLSNPVIWGGVIGTAVLLAALVVSLRWTRALLTGWLIFFVAIFPTLGVIQFSWVSASDKYMYLPALGLLMILGWGLDWGWQLSGRKLAISKVTVVALALLVSAAEVRGVRRYLVHWRDTVSLYEHMLTLAPNSSQVHNNLGFALQSQGELHQAISHFRQSLELKPDNLDARNNLASTLAALGRVDEAISHYRQVLQRNPEHAGAHHNLGEMLVSKGQLDEALFHLREAVRLAPEWPAPLRGMAWILARHPAATVRDPNQAIRLAERAAELTRYQDPKYLMTLSAVYAAAGRFDRAVTTAERALDLAIAAGAERETHIIRQRLEHYRQASP